MRPVSVRSGVAALAFAALSCTAAFGASPDEILAANRIASGGDAWNGKAAVQFDFDYAGQGLPGTASGTTIASPLHVVIRW